MTTQSCLECGKVARPAGAGSGPECGVRRDVAPAAGSRLAAARPLSLALPVRRGPAAIESLRSIVAPRACSNRYRRLRIVNINRIVRRRV